MMKPKTLLLAALLAATAAHADDLSLYLEPTAGETTSYEVSTLQKMTFENGKVVLTKKDGTTSSTAIATLSRMYFNQTLTAINALIGQTPTSYTLYNMNGVRVGEGTATTAADIATGQLAHGVYIVSIKDQNFKIVR